MNLKRFTGRTTKDAMNLVRQAFGDDAVLLSTKPSSEGVEVLALAPENFDQIERVAAPPEPAPQPQPPRARMPLPPRNEPTLEGPGTASVEQDVAQLQMSTLSFQDYVRQRMQNRREAEHQASARAAAVAAERARAPAQGSAALRERSQGLRGPVREVPVLRDEVVASPAPARREARARAVADLALPNPLHEHIDPQALLSELRNMKGLIEDRFGALAFMDKLQRHPRHAALAQRLLDCGLSPLLARRLVDSLPADAPDDLAWAAGVLERNLNCAESEPGLEDAQGIYALVGPTGVGKTTCTAKLGAAFAARHGAAQLGLITLDAYRMGAHEQLRSYGRILGVPVHTAHDRASLEDLLELLKAKRLVLIDTAGMAQRDHRTRELLDMLASPGVQNLLVLNAAAQAETLEDVLQGYRATQAAGVLLSKLDEAVKLGPVLDAFIRHHLKVLAVANGQRVPEDWHRLSANALVHRALRASTTAAWRLDGGDLNLVFAALPSAGAVPRQPKG